MNTEVPKAFVSGDTVKFTKTFEDYPASDGWELQYIFVSMSKQVAITATANGDDFDVVIPANTQFHTENYAFQGYISKGTGETAERYTVDNGNVEITENLLLRENGFDTRSEIKQTLDAIQSTLKNIATKGQLERKVGSRSLKYIPPSELIKMETYYRKLYHAELRKSQGISKWGRQVKYEFN